MKRSVELDFEIDLEIDDSLISDLTKTEERPQHLDQIPKYHHPSTHPSVNNTKQSVYIHPSVSGQKIGIKRPIK